MALPMRARTWMWADGPLVNKTAQDTIRCTHNHKQQDSRHRHNTECFHYHLLSSSSPLFLGSVVVILQHCTKKKLSKFLVFTSSAEFCSAVVCNPQTTAILCNMRISACLRKQPEPKAKSGSSSLQSLEAERLGLPCPCVWTARRARRTSQALRCSCEKSGKDRWRRCFGSRAQSRMGLVLKDPCAALVAAHAVAAPVAGVAVAAVPGLAASDDMEGAL